MRYLYTIGRGMGGSTSIITKTRSKNPSDREKPISQKTHPYSPWHLWLTYWKRRQCPVQGACLPQCKGRPLWHPRQTIQSLSWLHHEQYLLQAGCQFNTRWKKTIGIGRNNIVLKKIKINQPSAMVVERALFGMRGGEKRVRTGNWKLTLYLVRSASRAEPGFLSAAGGGAVFFSVSDIEGIKVRVKRV